MGISPSDLDKFKDPRHWVCTFPAMAVEDLSHLGLMCNFSRSFVTTDINPYFDRFIGWQFRNLHAQGRLKYAKRPCIYSIVDGQPCADHDRQSGEGVKPKAYRLYLHGSVFSIDREAAAPAASTASYLVDGTWYGNMPEFWFHNLKHQGVDIEPVNERPATLQSSTIDTGVTIWLPESTVISRTGDKCIVAYVSQWYLTYSDAEWKAATKKALDKMTIHDPELRKQLEIALEGMDDWCVSREYGLGTRLPCDERFIIDSLSDSTIYMAYYTICHMLHTDLYGKKEVIPLSEINDQFWDSVFLGRSFMPTVDVTSGDTARNILVKRLHEEFRRFYPPCFRVSGKDLIYNHLIMSIYNHVAIFGPEMCCREYLVNGHAKLNDKKMSKSTGNYITINQACKMYRTDALRLLLIEAGDGLDDANVRLNTYESTLAALNHQLSQLYLDMIIHCHTLAQHSFRVGRFRDAVTYGWRKVSKVISCYEKHPGYLPWIVDLGNLVCSYTLAPVLGLSLPELPALPVLETDPTTYYEFVQTIHSSINKYKQARQAHQQLQVQIHNKLQHHEQDLKLHINALYGLDAHISYDNTVLHPNRDPYRIKPVVG
jgi:leucyl-tRNA synthetase